jgi:hypothetical protein
MSFMVYMCRFLFDVKRPRPIEIGSFTRRNGGSETMDMSELGALHHIPAIARVHSAGKAQLALTKLG